MPPDILPRPTLEQPETQEQAVPFSSIELPILRIDAPLEHALGVMKYNDKSAIIAADEGGYWLIDAGWVVVGMSRGEQTLAEVEKRHRVHYDPQPAASILLKKASLTQSKISQLLDDHGGFFMLDGPPVLPMGKVEIVMKHGAFLYNSSCGPADHYCTNPNIDSPHHYPPPPVPPNRRCLVDDYPIV